MRQSRCFENSKTLFLDDLEGGQREEDDEMKRNPKLRH